MLTRCLPCGMSEAVSGYNGRRSSAQTYSADDLARVIDDRDGLLDRHSVKTARMDPDLPAGQDFFASGRADVVVVMPHCAIRFFQLKKHGMSIVQCLGSVVVKHRQVKCVLEKLRAVGVSTLETLDLIAQF